MAKKIQIGFIGGGMIANAHMKNFHADRRTEIRALADVNTQALQAIGGEYGIPHLTTDYRDILKDPGLDAVVVHLAPGSHANEVFLRGDGHSRRQRAAREGRGASGENRVEHPKKRAFSFSDAFDARRSGVSHVARNRNRARSSRGGIEWTLRGGRRTAGTDARGGVRPPRARARFAAQAIGGRGTTKIVPNRHVL